MNASNEIYENSNKNLTWIRATTLDSVQFIAFFPLEHFLLSLCIHFTVKWQSYLLAFYLYRAELQICVVNFVIISLIE